MNNKWERRDNKRSKKIDGRFKIRGQDTQEKETAKKVSKQKREWAVLNREDIRELDDEEDSLFY